MTEGIPPVEFGRRHVLLEWQHRMHGEIAKFPSARVYGGNALITPKALEAERAWRYGRYGKRSVWMHVEGSAGRASEEEAKVVSDEIKNFYDFACRNRRKDGLPWEVAVLTFYIRQRQVMLRRLGEISDRADRDQGQFCMRHENRDAVTIQCQTLDSFQGHEADVVFLSIASDRPTAFLENPNRVNVAVTRARYQNVIVGNRVAMAKSDSLLGALAGETHRHGGGPQ